MNHQHRNSSLPSSHSAHLLHMHCQYASSDLSLQASWQSEFPAMSSDAERGVSPLEEVGINERASLLSSTHSSSSSVVGMCRCVIVVHACCKCLQHHDNTQVILFLFLKGHIIGIHFFNWEPCHQAQFHRWLIGYIVRRGWRQQWRWQVCQSIQSWGCSIIGWWEIPGWQRYVYLRVVTAPAAVC